MKSMIRTATDTDADSISRIYNHYILNTVVTFEEEAVSPNEISKRIKEVQEKFPWLVYELNGSVVGYAYGSAWKSRCAYRHSAEVSVYLDPNETGKRIGSELYQELIIQLAALNIHGIIGGIALPNDACIALHEKFGFEKVAHFKEVGHKFNKWIDVVYFEKILK